MLKADTAPKFEWCPRCETGGLEKLPTHSHCLNCNYSPDFEHQSNSGSYYYPLDITLKKQLLELLGFAGRFDLGWI